MMLRRPVDMASAVLVLASPNHATRSEDKRPGSTTAQMPIQGKHFAPDSQEFPSSAVTNDRITPHDREQPGIGVCRCVMYGPSERRHKVEGSQRAFSLASEVTGDVTVQCLCGNLAGAARCCL